MPCFMDERWGQETDILIGCVDSRAARNAITRTQTYWNCHYWLDLGNNADSGQFVLGQPENQKNKSASSVYRRHQSYFPNLSIPNWTVRTICRLAVQSRHSSGKNPS